MTGSEPPDVHDVVGVGFGPSNLSLAIAIAERNETTSGCELTARFVERQSRFGWHRGMLIDDAVMQVSYLKDLVTLRNPTSRYGFLSYLHEHGRMVDFINYGSPFPLRVEFHDYLEWAAAGFAGAVDYGHEVVEIRRTTDPGVLDVVSVCGGQVRVHPARNVVVAPGLVPNVPAGVTLGARVWHNHDLLHRLYGLDPAGVRRVAVVGAGQSAAETLRHLHRTFPGAEVHAVFSRFGYSPADSSAFVNRIFDPEAVDEFYAAPEATKEMLLRYHRNTNYSVVESGLIDDLYRTHYQERVRGAERLRFHRAATVSDVEERADRVDLGVESTIDGGRQRLALDLVVFATGYRPTDPMHLLGELGSACKLGQEGQPEVRRDHRVVTDESLTAGIYLQGSTQQTHGLSATLLSTVAVRTGEIVESVAAARTAEVNR